MPLEDKDLYKELGNNFRLTLRWRELLFAGFLAVSGALSIGFYKLVVPSDSIDVSRFIASPIPREVLLESKNNQSDLFSANIAWVVPLVGSALAFGFLLLDRRCHEVLLGNYQLGKTLEQWKTGYYSTAVARGKHPQQITHTSVLQSIYVVAGLAFLILSTIWGFADNSVDAATNARIPVDMKEYMIWGLPLVIKSLPGLTLTFLGYKLLSPNLSQLSELKEGYIQESMKRIKSAQIAGYIAGAFGIVYIFIMAVSDYFKG